MYVSGWLQKKTEVDLIARNKGPFHSVQVAHQSLPVPLVVITNRSLYSPPLPKPPKFPNSHTTAAGVHRKLHPSDHYDQAKSFRVKTRLATARRLDDQAKARTYPRNRAPSLHFTLHQLLGSLLRDLHAAHHLYKLLEAHLPVAVLVGLPHELVRECVHVRRPVLC